MAFHIRNIVRVRRTPVLLPALACYLGIVAIVALPRAAGTSTPLTCANIFSGGTADPVVIEWRANSLKRFEVSSADTKTRTLGATLGDLGLQDPDGKHVMTADVIKVLPPSSPVNAGQGVVFTIEVTKTPAIKPGVYVGGLTLTLDSDNEPKGCSTRLAVQLTVPEAEPLADKATLRYYRLLPLPFVEPYSLWEHTTVPLRGSVTSLTNSSAREAPLGLVQNERGHTATVYRADEQIQVSDGVMGLPLKVEGHTHAGVYEGQLKLNPSGDRAGGLKLSVIVTDIFVWPLIVIGLSVWLGLRIQRYVNVERTLWRLLGQEAALGVAFRESHRRFVESASGAPYADYSIAADLAQRRKTLREKIGALQASSALTLNPADEKYKEVVDEVEALRKGVAAWGVFGGELNALQDALAPNPHMGNPPSGYEGNAPALFITYRALLNGETLTLTQFAERRQQVQDAAKVLGDWYEQARSIEDGERHYEKLKLVARQMSEGDVAQLAAALKGLNISRHALWRAKNTAELAAVSDPFGSLAAVKKTLLELAATYGGQPAAEGGVMTPHALGAKPEMLAHAFGPGAGDAPQDDAARMRYYDQATANWDRRLAWLSFAIATLTVLYNNYLGKAFGSLKDYVNLLIIGLGTKLMIDASSAVLSRLFGAGRDGLQRK